MNSETEPFPVAQAVQAAIERHQAGRLDEAEHMYRRVLKFDPANVDALPLLGVVAGQLGRFGEAERCFRDALALNSGYAEPQCNLGQALRAQGRLPEAEESFQRALALRPAFAEAHNYLANVLRSLGRLAEAGQSYRHALALDPDHAETHSNLIFLLNYLPGMTPEEIFAEHRRFAQRFCLAPIPGPHGNAPDPERRLRVGYVSGNLRELPTLDFMDRLMKRRGKHGNVKAVTVLKCHSADRANSYRLKSAEEQVRYWDLIRHDREFLVRELLGVIECQLVGAEPPKLPQDKPPPLVPPGWQIEQWRRMRGLEPMLPEAHDNPELRQKSPTPCGIGLSRGMAWR